MITSQNCAHRRHVPFVIGLNEPWKSSWGEKGYPDEDGLLPPMPGSGLSLFEYGLRCADCGKILENKEPRSG